MLAPNQVSSEEPTPNQSTVPHTPAADPLKEPVRPTQERREPDRFAPAVLATQYSLAAGLIELRRGGDVAPAPNALYVSFDGMSDRFADLAFAATGDEEAANTARERFEALDSIV